jgi:hypothetical protein
MARRRSNDRRQALPGQHNSLSLRELRALTDVLVRDPALAWRTAAGIDPAVPGPSAVSAEDVYRWSHILDDARELELERAPTASDFGLAGGSLAVGQPALASP